MLTNAPEINLTPEQFELEVKAILEASASGLSNFSVQHRKSLSGVDGEYEIDIFAKFTALGVGFQVLVECKRYSSPVKREAVQILNDRIRSTGSQKGMLFSTSGFQSGAIEYAAKHGIALVHLVDGKMSYSTRSMYGPKEPPSFIKVPSVVGRLFGISADQRPTISHISCDFSDYLDEFLEKQ